MSLSPSSKRRRLLPLPPPYNRKDQRRTWTFIPSLPEDFVREILVRIPAKTLIRFMCVCKSWFRLISDPEFAKLHFNRSLAAPTHRVLYKPPRLGFQYNQIHASPRSVDIDAPFCHELTVPFPNFDCKLSQTRSPYRVYGICNGCILLLSRCCSNNLTLWNPLTRTYKVLPLSPNASKFSHVSGLGYDEATNDFLVVLTSFIKMPAGADIACYLEIFSVRKNSWEVMVLQHPFSIKWETFTYRSWGLFFNGVIHWAVPAAKVILCFDLRLRRLSEMITPNENHRLMVVGGSLASHDRTKVSVMKEYNVQSSWIVYCDVKTNHYPICFNNDGKMIALLNPARNDEKLVKLNDNGYQLDSRDSCYDNHLFGRVVYRESLFSFSCQIRCKDNRSELCSNPIRSREGTTDKPSKD